MDILVLEDSRMAMRMIEIATKGRAMIHPAGNLAEARRSLVKQTYDMAIVDLMLPDGSGQEFIPEIRKNPLNKDIPILVFSSSLTELTQQEVILLGANEWLKKPAQPIKILETIITLQKTPYSRLPPRKFVPLQTIIWHEQNNWSAYVIGLNTHLSHTCNSEVEFNEWLTERLQKSSLPPNIAIPRFPKLSTILLKPQESVLSGIELTVK